MIKAPTTTPASPAATQANADPLAALAQPRTRPLPPLQTPPASEPIQLAEGSVNAAGKPSPYGLKPSQWDLIRSGNLK